MYFLQTIGEISIQNLIIFIISLIRKHVSQGACAMESALEVLSRAATMVNTNSGKRILAQLSRFSINCLNTEFSLSYKTNIIFTRV